MSKYTPHYVFSIIILFYIITYLSMTPVVNQLIKPWYTDILPTTYKMLHTSNPSTFIKYYTKKDYPPLYVLSAAGMLTLFQKDWILMTIANNTLYFLLMLLFLYLLGKEISNRYIAIYSCILISLYPLTWGEYRTFSTDFPLIGITAMSIFFFLKSHYFSMRKWSILFTLSCAAGLLIKHSFALFISGPILYSILFIFLQVRHKNYKPLFNLFLCSGIFLIFLYPFYISNNFSFFLLSFKGPFLEPLNIPWYSFDNLRSITVGLWENILTFPFFLLFITGMYFFYTRSNKNIILIFLLYFIPPYLFLIFMPHWKSPRYFMPLLPLFAIVSSFALYQPQKRTSLMRFATSVLIITGILQYYIITYYYPQFEHRNKTLARLLYNPYTAHDVDLSYQNMATHHSTLNLVNNTISRNIVLLNNIQNTKHPRNILIYNYRDEKDQKILINLPTLFFFIDNDITSSSFSLFERLRFYGSYDIVLPQLIQLLNTSDLIYQTTRFSGFDLSSNSIFSLTRAMHKSFQPSDKYPLNSSLNHLHKYTANTTNRYGPFKMHVYTRTGGN